MHRDNTYFLLTRSSLCVWLIFKSSVTIYFIILRAKLTACFSLQGLHEVIVVIESLAVGDRALMDECLYTPVISAPLGPGESWHHISSHDTFRLGISQAFTRTWEGLFFNLCKSIVIDCLVPLPHKFENLPVNIWPEEFSCD